MRLTDHLYRGLGVPLLFVLLYACQHKKEDKQQQHYFDFEHPVVYRLPMALQEVSGVDVWSPGVVACVQDEEGVVFLYDLKNEKIIEEISFGKKGDYEDLECVQGRCYVLKSDGDIFEFHRPFKGKEHVLKHETRLKQHQDTEGLCLGPSGEKLWVLCKETGKKKKPHRDIYAFDLKKGKVMKKPIVKIKIQSMLRQKGLKNKAFKPAAIAIHPITSVVYLVDSVSGLLVSLTPSYTIAEIFQLDLKLLPQSEGLAFDREGNMFISSEAKHGVGAKIVSFKFQAIP